MVKQMLIGVGIYLLAVNLITFFLFGIDKWKARKDRWRIKEVTLLVCCLIGGAVGGLLGMRLFHHKTKKAKFYICVPLCLILHIAIAVAIVYFCLKK